MTPNDDPATERNRLSRRAILAGGSNALLATLAGCLDTSDSESGDGGESGDETPTPPGVTESENVPTVPRVTDPPEAVYLPSHRTQMVHLDTVDAGPYTVGPMVSYPHSFWLVTGSNVERVRPQGPGVHLMFSVWDTETETVLPVDVGAEVRLRHDGDVVDTRSPWPMISQTMGFHFGDNIYLDETGTYTAEVDLNPITVRRTGEFAGLFESRQTAIFEFEFDREFQRRLVEQVSYLDESEWGNQGALEPMGGTGESGSAQGTHDGESAMGDGGEGSNMNAHGGDSGMEGHGMPFSSLPTAETYPGEPLGGQTSGDARFIVRYLPESRLADGGYLLVSPRTPYNRIPLADMALSVSGALEGELVQTLDGELGHHYGLAGRLEPGETVELAVDSPPQVARHAGYETAFLEMEPMTMEVPE
jgi:hypothetical protein